MFSRNVVLKAISILALACLLSAELVGEDANGINGKVVDKAEHAPIGNVYVLAHRNGGKDKSVRTDESGKYVMELLPSIYDVFISADGFAPTCRKIQVPRGGMVAVDAILDVSKVDSRETSAQATPSGVVGDIPGGLPSDGNNSTGGILSSEPQLPRVASPTHIRVSQGVMRTFLITKVTPTYPAEAEARHVDGTVLLRINIDKSGNVSNVDPVSGHPLLIPAAIDAAKQWKYKPYLLNQKPVEVETVVMIKFVLSDGNAYSVIASG